MFFVLFCFPAGMFGWFNQVLACEFFLGSLQVSSLVVHHRLVTALCINNELEHLGVLKWLCEGNDSSCRPVRSLPPSPPQMFWLYDCTDNSYLHSSRKSTVPSLGFPTYPVGGVGCTLHMYIVCSEGKLCPLLSHLWPTVSPWSTLILRESQVWSLK